MRPSKVKQSIALSISKARKRKGWRQEDMEARTGVPYSTYRRFESKGEGSFENLIKIVSVLGEPKAFEKLFPEPEYESLDDVGE